MASIPDYSGIPTHECVCGCNLFRTCVTFDDYVVSGYTCTGYCYGCGARVTLPTELDRPEGVYDSYVTV